MIDFNVVNNAISLSKRLSEIAKKVNNAEITSIAADLMLELAETKMALANAKAEQQELIYEVSELKKEKKKIFVHGNLFFKFEEDSDELFCTWCFENEGKLLHLVTAGDNRGCLNCDIKLFPDGTVG